MKRKINKKKIVILVIIIIILITVPTFGRYVYYNVRDAYLRSKNFSFSSNLLTTTGRTYVYSNWSGVDPYPIKFDLYSYENELSLFTYEGNGLGYTVTCTVDDSTKASVHVGSLSGTNTSESGTYIPNSTNKEEVSVFLKPIANLSPGQSVKVTIVAKTESPYKKQIKATFELKVSDESIGYTIQDSPNSIYATLKIVNAQNSPNDVTLTFDPDLVMIDTADEAYVNGEILDTEDGYVSSVKITVGGEQSKDIKFYKREITADYTYNGLEGEDMVVTITD